MATDDGRERFEDIDWDRMGSVGLSRIAKQQLAFLVGFAGLLAYDFLVVASGDPTIDIGVPEIVLDALNLILLPGGFDLVWDISSVDWLTLLMFAVGYFYVVVPLNENRRLTAYYWRRFKQSTPAVISAIYLGAIFAVGFIGPLILGEPEINPGLAYQPPVFASVEASTPLQCVGETVTRQVSVSGEQVSREFCTGTMQYPLGTTGDGKDILKQIVLGMRITMQIGLITMMVVIIIGTLVGTAAAYFGGYVDEVLMRYVDIQATFPAFFLFLLLAYLIGGSLFLLILLFGFFGWEGIARLVRSEALQRREEEYIQAAENAGASDGWIIRRHLMPNVSNTVITAATLLIPGFILAEAAFSFIGITDPSITSWGRLISSGRGDLSSAWWIATLPGVFLFFTILAFNFIGDALNDALDPRRENQ